MRRLFVLCTVVIGLLGGCGFQLRGTATPLPERFMKTYFMNTLTTNDKFERKVKNLMVLGGGELVARDAAHTAVKVGEVKVYSRQIAESGNGLIKEYERRYSSTVTVTDLKTGVQLGSREVAVTRNIQLSENQVLAGEEQSRVTRDGAESSLAQAVIRYLKTF